jgi:hypothetical protein
VGCGGSQPKEAVWGVVGVSRRRPCGVWWESAEGRVGCGGSQPKEAPLNQGQVSTPGRSWGVLGAGSGQAPGPARSRARPAVWGLRVVSWAGAVAGPPCCKGTGSCHTVPTLLRPGASEGAVPTGMVQPSGGRVAPRGFHVGWPPAPLLAPSSALARTGPNPGRQIHRQLEPLGAVHSVALDCSP